jgi:iron complex transport system ATP-binding protein
MLTAENISFGYTPGSDLIHNLSFSISEGDIACLLGPNGAGKTTLLRCMLGISKINQGTIKLQGRPISGLSAAELSRHMAYVPQSATSVFPYRVLEMVVMGRNPHLGFAAVPSKQDLNIAAEALAQLGIAHLAGRGFGEISGGERQLTLIARALTQQVGLLIMDEPTSSLDYGNQVRILKIIDKLAKCGYTIIMTSHFPNHAFLTCNKVMMMKHGKITVMGDPEEVVTENSLSELYDTSVKIFRIEDETNKPVKVCLPLLC